MKRIKKTGPHPLPAFRRLDFPNAGFTREAHAALANGETVEVHDMVASYLLDRGVAEEVTE